MCWNRASVVAPRTLSERTRVGPITTRRFAMRWPSGLAVTCVAAPPHAPSSRSSANVLWPGGRKFGDNQPRMCGTCDLNLTPFGNNPLYLPATSPLLTRVIAAPDHCGSFWYNAWRADLLSFMVRRRAADREVVECPEPGNYEHRGRRQLWHCRSMSQLGRGPTSLL